MSLKCFSKLKYGVSLCWENISYSVNSNGKILDSISGYILPSSVLCIVGHSGSGKTSLIEILCGIRRNSEKYISGNVYYNNILTKTRNYDCSVYCPQDIILNNQLTIRESIEYSCKLTNTNNNRINDLINALNLNKCQNTLILHASYGEKKRCFIATQIINQPNILFFDEILSGLDSTNAYNIFNIINQLKNFGHTIIISIHQPSIKLFNMMNKFGAYLMILKNGKSIYFDKTYNCLTYFNNITYIKHTTTTSSIKHIDDILLINDKNQNILINTFQNSYKKNIFNNINNIIKKYNNNQNYNIKIYQKNVFTKNKQNISIIKQITILTKKNMIANIRNIDCYWMRVLALCGVAMLTGHSYYDVNNTYNAAQNHIYFLNIEIVHASMLSLANIMHFIDHRNLYISQRFYSNKYCCFAYSMATVISVIPWQLLNCLMFCLITINLVNPVPFDNEEFYYYFIMHFLGFFCLNICMEVCSIALSTMSSEYLLNFTASWVTLAFLCQFCGGPMLLFSDIPKYFKWVYYLSPFTYATKYMMYLDFHDLQITVNKNEIIEGNQILKNFDMENVDLVACLLILCGLTCFFHFLFYLSLKYWIKPKYYS